MTTQPTFAELGVPAALVDVLVAEGRPTPFPIQAATLPSTLAGRDVLGRGKTGSGKTLAFAIPLVANLAVSGRAVPGRPTGLVLAPTRELATQIARVVTPLAEAEGLSVATVFGGVSQRPQEAAFRAGVDIVVACPGRLDDLIKQGIVSLERVRLSVLDEADHMADLGFLPVVTRLLSQTANDAQRLFFSATLDNGVDKLVKRFLHNPERHSLDPADSPVPAMTHHVYEVAGAEEKTAMVRTLASGAARRILFTRTKHQAKKLARQLTARGIPAVDLQGNLSQNARDRNLGEFSSGRVRVLVATDVAARGVHVDDVELVVHVDPPAEHKAYLHRSGRTARAGHAGDVVTLMLPEQRDDTRKLLRQAGIKATPQRVDATAPAVAELVGEVAEHVEPTAGGPGSGNAPAPQPAGAPRSQGANARRKRASRGRGGRGRGSQGSQGTQQGQGGQSAQGSQQGRSGQGGRQDHGGASRQSGQGRQSGQSGRSGQGGQGGRGGQRGRRSGSGAGRSGQGEARRG